MRLINTRILDLEEFQNEDDLHYAILSHRWEEGEVTLQDTESGQARAKPGFTKIKRFYKKSSAELSEAINSMYRWYRRARVCYAFLSDVHDTPKSAEFDSSLRGSQWFTRGWTSQELLAPPAVHFYNHSWQPIGTRGSLSTLIEEETRIDKLVLSGRLTVLECSIADRMSWAAHRKTTRVEGRAYSLMGLFDVNMPMLYGEGEKAFVRLQEEIIHHSDDHSIFAWSLPLLGEYPGLLAPSPDAFSDSDAYLAILNCTEQHPCIGARPSIGIFLRRLKQDDQYEGIPVNSSHRINVLGRDMENRPTRNVTINVRQRVHYTEYPSNLLLGPLALSIPRIYGYHISMPEVNDLIKGHYQIVEVPDVNKWDPRTGIITMQNGGFGTAGVIDLSTLDVDLRKIKIGFDFDHNPLFFATERATPGSKILSSGNLNASPSIAFDISNCLDQHGRLIAVPQSGIGQEGQNGVWAIQGHWWHGLQALLVTSSRPQRLADCYLRVKIERRAYGPGIIWELEIIGLIPPGKRESTVGRVL
ncbi:HET-domain-containing protein [Xylaria digitata]|nr:HET-domain-containing protein [Xylaria digitata]